MKTMTYQLGLYEKSMPTELSWKQRLTLAREAGFDFVELSVDESDARLARLAPDNAEVREMEEAMLQSGMYLRTMCLSGHRKYPLGSHDPAVRARSLEIMEAAIHLAWRLGIRIIQLAGYDVYYESADAQSQAFFAENLQECVDMAARMGVLLAFETMETPFMDTCAKAMQYVKRVDSPYLRIYPDIGNLTNAMKINRHDVLEDIRSARGGIVAAHLKETRPGIYREIPFGMGHTDFVACARELFRAGVRLFVGEFWYTGSSTWEADVAFAARFLRQKLETACSMD